MSDCMYVATGPRNLDDRVLHTLHRDLKGPWDAFTVLRALRAIGKDDGCMEEHIESALRRLVEAGRVRRI